MNPYVKFKPQERKVAYFSMEVGLRPEIPTYSGGLGILAGDTLKSFADLTVPAVGVTLLYTKGYFHQETDPEGNQIEIPVNWRPADYLTLLRDKVTGWSIGPRHIQEQMATRTVDLVDAEDLYNKLEQQIIPCFYQNRPQWMAMMAYNIALNGSFFNTHRMVSQYVLEAYFQ
ncbi:MAG TPA: hypothetical protein ENN66_05025 [Proteobacteria bacterium]|nr:hypothetical protein [Pseudomonadota bacterium]